MGHSRKGDSGAVNTAGVSEHKFNSLLAVATGARLRKAGYVVHIVDRYEGATYAAAMKWLGSHLKEIGANAALELHFNSAGPTAHGHEWLYWANSPGGLRLAKYLDSTFVAAFPDARRRGVKPLGVRSRGARFLQETPCVAVICEPFFGSNRAETDFYSGKVNEIAAAYTAAVQKFLR